jgi:hypothetical protein
MDEKLPPFNFVIGVLQPRLQSRSAQGDLAPSGTSEKLDMRGGLSGEHALLNQSIGFVSTVWHRPSNSGRSTVSAPCKAPLRQGLFRWITP